MNRINLRKLRAKLAVSEIIGTVLLLGIATSCLSIIYFNVLSNPAPNPAPIVEISGTIEENQLILMHRGGEPLDLDTDFVLNIGGKSLSFKVEDFLDSSSKEDGVWSIGEKIIYPIEYDFDYSEYPDLKVNIIDDFSNSIVMTGITKIHPTCDVGVSLTVDQLYPKRYDYVVFNLTVTNYWNINASGAIIEFLLPEALSYVNSSINQGSYNSSNGLWDVGTINVGCYATLNIVAKVEELYYNETTQFVVFLDGSKTYPIASSWQLMCNGLAHAIGNEEVFPHDDSVELTIIQFGVDDVCARVEIGPIVVNEDNVQSINNKINVLKGKQGQGRISMASAFYLGDDTVAESENFGGFNPDYKQVILLVTHGNANVISNLGSYCGTASNATLGKNSAAIARDYLLDGLKMTEDKDEIDVIAVDPGPSNTPIDEQFLNEKIVWPQPSYNGTPPPEDDLGWPPAGTGWYRYVESWDEFSDSIDGFFRTIFNSITVIMKIKSTAFLDPIIVNDESVLVLKVSP